MMGKKNRYHNESSLAITDKGVIMAERMLNDVNYERKVSEVMAIMSGKRIAGRQGLGSPVWRD